jgi:hypothetical protein
LLAGAALYFGLTRNSGKLGDVTKTAVSRLVDDQVSRNSNKRDCPAQKMKPRFKKHVANNTHKIRLKDIQAK